jgi:TRAP-type C4-dicarboxylate transport system substrate-binding protein
MLLRQLFIRSTSLAAGAALLLGAAATTANAQDFTMKIGLGTFKDVQHQWADWMEETIEAKSNGRIDVQVFPKSQLGNIFRMVEGVQLGTLESVVAPMDFYAGIDPKFGVFSIPVLFKDKTNASKALLDTDLNKEIRTIGGDKNVVTISVFPHSTAHYFGKEPIRRLDDFKGLKLRVNATAAEREKMKRFGATAVPMPLNEVVPGLQRGTIDGTMSGTVVYVVFKFNQVGKVLTQTNDTMILSAGLVSKTWLDKLPADLQKVVLDAGVDLQARTAEFSDTSEIAMVERWKAEGGELISLPEEDLVKVRSSLASVGEDVTKDDPALNAFYKKVRSTAAKY